MLSLRDELHERGFLYQYTDEKLFDIYNNGGNVFYFGCDPTADSLHLGNFVVFMNAVNYMKRGNKLIMIVGGATGMIGDPGGRDSERSFLSDEQVQHNVDAITTQVDRVLTHLTALSGVNFDFVVMNNKQFYTTMSFLQFLRDVGKHITVNQMMNKETVKKRIEDPDKSISYTEFSYMLLQGYDYVRLFQEYGCRLQISGSDQWGNIVTGVELIKKKLDQEAYGMTSPLILDSSGKKFGKSAGNALRLDATKTTPFDIYQYFMNTSDSDVEKYLKLFTLLDLDTISNIVKTHEEKPEDRYGQKQLAIYVTTTLHGETAANDAAQITDFLFGSGDKVHILQSAEPSFMTSLHHATGGHTMTHTPDKRCLEYFVDCGLASSNGEAKKLIESKSLAINEKVIENVSDTHNHTPGDYLLLRKGKKQFILVKVV